MIEFDWYDKQNEIDEIDAEDINIVAKGVQDCIAEFEEVQEKIDRKGEPLLLVNIISGTGENGAEYRASHSFDEIKTAVDNGIPVEVAHIDKRYRLSGVVDDCVYFMTIVGYDDYTLYLESIVFRRGMGNVPSLVYDEPKLFGPEVAEQYVKHTDYATSTKAGVVTVGAGLEIKNGTVRINKASDKNILDKTTPFYPIVPSNLDLAVKTSIATNTLALSDEEQNTAQQWLGIGKNYAPLLGSVSMPIGGQSISNYDSVELQGYVRDETSPGGSLSITREVYTTRSIDGKLQGLSITNTKSGTDVVVIPDSARAHDLINYTIYGNSRQETAPEIESPAEIYSLGRLISYGDVSMYEIIIEHVRDDGRNPYYQILLNEPLRKVGDYADYIDFENGKVIRNVLAVTFTGEESWYSNKSEWFHKTIEGAKVGGIYNGISNRLTYVRNAYGSLSQEGFTGDEGGNQYLYVRIAGITTISDFKAKLAEWNDSGKPLEIYVILSSPIEESIDLQPIAIDKGQNNLYIAEYQNGASPSKFDVKYYQDTESRIKELENAIISLGGNV